MLPSDLPLRWRKRSWLFREHGVEPAALAYERCADQLDAALARLDEEPLTLRQAAEETGYSLRHLRRLMEDGTIPNSGTPATPRLTRAHLPRKPGHGIAPHVPRAASSITQVARAIATRGDDNGST